MQWKEVDVHVAPMVEDGLKKLTEGTATPEIIGAFLIAKSMARDVHFGWDEDELENENLGIVGLSDAEMEELIRTRATGELIDTKKVYEGAWKIDVR